MAPSHCFSTLDWIVLSHLRACELPGLEAAGNSSEQLMWGANT